MGQQEQLAGRLLRTAVAADWAPPDEHGPTDSSFHSAEVQQRPRKPAARAAPSSRTASRAESAARQARRLIARRVNNRDSAARTRQRRRDGLRLMEEEVEAAQLESLALHNTVDEAEASRQRTEVDLHRVQGHLEAAIKANNLLAEELKAVQTKVEQLRLQPLVGQPVQQPAAICGPAAPSAGKELQGYSLVPQALLPNVSVPNAPSTPDPLFSSLADLPPDLEWDLSL